MTNQRNTNYIQYILFLVKFDKLKYSKCKKEIKDKEGFYISSGGTHMCADCHDG